ncbi:hypothetical protein EUX98_g6144 [Antrodiella citrinella]|uniref:Uncharacterized protein n=1 Tax=Antrodiella citrinella TaxID=2447956 RepID=A0A4S4MPP6_9APHY|nr:hypothetical protein EUX98_g6144 [Antrodiella citrinella]
MNIEHEVVDTQQQQLIAVRASNVSLTEQLCQLQRQSQATRDATLALYGMRDRREQMIKLQSDILRDLTIEKARIEQAIAQASDLYIVNAMISSVTLSELYSSTAEVVALSKSKHALEMQRATDAIEDCRQQRATLLLQLTQGENVYGARPRCADSVRPNEDQVSTDTSGNSDNNGAFVPLNNQEPSALEDRSAQLVHLANLLHFVPNASASNLTRHHNDSVSLSADAMRNEISDNLSVTENGDFVYLDDEESTAQELLDMIDALRPDESVVETPTWAKLTVIIAMALWAICVL